MKFERAYIPLGAAWTSPFAKWQGSFADISSIDLATQVTASALRSRNVDLTMITSLAVGMTVPQPESFYAASTLAHRIGLGHLSGPLIARACATSVGVLAHAAMTVEVGDGEETVLGVTGDRTSNGPHLVFPSSSGRVTSEDWVTANFARDPLTGRPMIDTAEAVSREAGFSRAQLDEMTLLRSQQYEQALRNDRDFQRRYFVPVEVPGPKGQVSVVGADEGVYPTTAEGLARLRSSSPDGVVTAGSQTHPADGAAGLVVTTRERAKAISGTGVARVLAIGTARAELGSMPKAPVPAARRALADAGVDAASVDAVTTHNPFAVNDLWLCRELGFEPERLNAYGSSLIYGHPQAPTGMRAIAELAETLILRGGGIGLFTGCAAGDTAAAAVIRVDVD